MEHTPRSDAALRAASPQPASHTQNTFGADPAIGAVRRFNRFHTRWLGALADGLLDSSFTLAQARVLHDLAKPPGELPWAASDLTRHLGMDAGQMSRLLADLQAGGWVARTPQAGHGKRIALALTAAGQHAFAQLDAASNQQMERLLAPLSGHQCTQLLCAMATIERLLSSGLAIDAPLESETAQPTKSPVEALSIVLRDPKPGDWGWVVHQHGALYAQEYGWNMEFEAMVAGIVSEFGKNFRPGREKCWIAEGQGHAQTVGSNGGSGRSDSAGNSGDTAFASPASQNGRVVGSAFVVQLDETTAKLRMLYVDPSVRGQGLGRRLVDECLIFAKAAGYSQMRLWTNDVLTAARHIYQSTGFTLLETEKHHSFGRDLVGEVWGRAL